MTVSLKDHDQRIVHSSEDPNWRTPKPLFAALDRHFNFAWDLAADADSTLLSADSSGLSAHYLGPGSSINEDAFDVVWSRLPYPIGFLNPPYSRKLYHKTKNPSFDIGGWAKKCWEESQQGATIVGLFPFTPQTQWYRKYVMGQDEATNVMGERLCDNEWSGHAAMEEWRLAHRVSFVAADGRKTSGAGHNVVVIVWRPNPGFVGPWQPAVRYWSYR